MSDFLTNLDYQIQNCSLCSLSGHGYATERIHPGTGKRVMFVGEAPGREEEIKKIPFVGRSGKLLDEWISYLKLDNYVITNVVKHRPNDFQSHGNFPPSPDTIAMCKSFLIQEISHYKPELIIFVGKIAASSMPLYEGKSMITMIKRGLEGKIGFHGIRAVAIYHPSFILRTNTEVQWILDSIKNIMDGEEDWE